MDPAGFSGGLTSMERDAVEIVVFGDIMIQGRVAERLQREGPDGLVERLRSLIGSADVTVGNFETFICPAGVKPGSQWHSPELAVEVVARAGIDAVSVATNHAWDHGLQTIRHTLQRLEKENVRTFGFGPEDGSAPQGIVLERQGIRLGLIGSATMSNVIGRPAYTAVSPASKAWESELSSLASRADVALATIHHGSGMYPSPSLCTWARSAAEIGADVVAVHHAHEVSGVESCRDAVIAYGLANAVARFAPGRCRENMLLRLFVEPARGIVDWRYELFQTDDDGYPQPMNESRQTEVHERIARISRDVQSEDYSNAYWSKFSDEDRTKTLRSWKRDIRQMGIKGIWQKLRHLRWEHLSLLRKVLLKR